MQMLKELGTIHTGSTPKTNDESLFGGDMPFVTPGDLGEVTPIQTTKRTLTDEGVKTGNLLPAGAVLVCCIGSLGKIGFAGRPVVTNQQINAIVFDDTKIDARYGFFACRMLRPQLELMAPATTVAIVNKSRFSELQIPVPPLLEQRRIAAILDQAENLRAQRRSALAQLDRLTQAIFLDMFGDPQINHLNLPTASLGSLMKLKSGNFLPASQMAEEGEFSVYGGNGINGLHDAFMFAEPKIVIGRVGAYCGCVHVTKPCSWVTDNALYLDAVSDSVQSEYLAFALTEARLNQYASQSGQPLITGARLAPIPLLVPPLPLQQTFATRIEAIETLKASHRNALSALDALFAALQQRAFAGKL